MDFQLHGFTRGELGETYPIQEAAADIASFIVRKIPQTPAIHFICTRLQELYNLQDALGLPRCVVLGVTLGAHVALQLALDFPGKVAGLFLISPQQTEEVRFEVLLFYFLRSCLSVADSETLGTA